jgi:hypothetical protein
MSYNLFLDDIRRPEDAFFYMSLPVFNSVEWIIIRNYYAFITLIEKKGIPETIAFDHDLADEHYKQQDFDYNREDYEKTGYHCAKWLIDYCMDNKKELPKEIIIHSMNPYGSRNIKSLFDTYIKVYNLEHSPIKILASHLR